ncbi:calcium-independent phospholipase A2-gamma [Diabrotica virgifera virgifera]|uniref:Calcium-independent phospholipase A2-gamma-like n=1 Tax=Diabrotica virgifera virgifera TaxID=50390 RepID=A0A6P7FA74_DIAVI|nr:calcium-independent phospholipase A2-gamma [Diabrotica virgifera virgifera]
MSLTKNLSTCGKCVVNRVPHRNIVSKRKYSSGSSNIESVKMQAKNIVLNQWRLINELKKYFSKFTNDKTFETALNKEFAQFLQKIDSKTYGKGLVKYFTSQSTDIVKNTPMHETKVEKDVKQEQSIPSRLSLPIQNVLSGLSINIKSKEDEKKEIIPRWKTVTKPIVSQEAIGARTSQILVSISLADNETMKIRRIEDLISHLEQYPEAKHNAVKEGGIRSLLKIRDTTKNPQLLSSLNVAITLLGYTDPVPGVGIRILSIDGGGVRGILVIEMLRKLEELSGKPIYEMFDFICGVSTGAIIATLSGLKQKSLDEISEIYKSISTQIFNQSAFFGTSNLVWSHSYYDTPLWEKLLQEQWQDMLLIETRRNLKVPKFCAVSAVVNQSRLSAYIFRNYSLPCKVQSQYKGGYNHQVWEAVRASAAAPTYFEEFKIGNMLHQDGGILVNNPTAVAIHEAKLLWPNTPIQCVLSFGTGRTVPNPVLSCYQDKDATITNSSWKKKFFAIIDSATDTEGVHTMLSDLLPTNVYYRFNPYLTEMLDIAEIDPNKLEQLKRDALMYLRRNEDKFHDAAKALNQKKSVTQKTMDWLSLRKEMHGINMF